MNIDPHEIFLNLVRFGIGVSADVENIQGLYWPQIKALADRQGLGAIVLDALNQDDTIFANEIPLQLKLEWIGDVIQGEQKYQRHQEVAENMAKYFITNGIRTFVIKGRVISECYPRPDHRVSCDMDCYLINATNNLNGPFSNEQLRDHEEAWEKGNELMRRKKVEVRDDFYKNSIFRLSGLMVENHRYLIPFRGNRTLQRLETYLQSQFMVDIPELRKCGKFEDSELCRPPVMVSALLLIEHAYSHFLHEGLTWRFVLDWVLFSRKHWEVIDWHEFENCVDEFGFRKFYDAFARLGLYLVGELHFKSLTFRDSLMLKDIWAPLDLHQTVRGVKGKLALAGNTWRARWKYRYFTEMNWIQALWIQTKGVLFEKYPQLY